MSFDGAPIRGPSEINANPGTPYVYGEPITPCAIADGKGNVSVVLVRGRYITSCCAVGDL